MSIKLSFNQSQLNKFLQNMETTEDNALVGAAEGIWDCAEHMYGYAFTLCPTDTYALRASLYKEIEVNPFTRTIIAIVGHGGENNRMNPKTHKMTDAYAIERHESMANRKENKIGHGPGKTKNFGTSKWMSRALGLTRVVFMPVVASRVRSALMNEDAETSYNLAMRAKYDSVDSLMSMKLAQSQRRKAMRGNKSKGKGKTKPTRR